jgi:hypothetical protein
MNAVVPGWALFTLPICAGSRELVKAASRIMSYLAMGVMFTGMIHYAHNGLVQQLEALPQGDPSQAVSFLLC